MCGIMPNAAWAHRARASPACAGAYVASISMAARNDAVWCAKGALAHLNQIDDEMRRAYADAGLPGLRQYMAEMAGDPRLEFDTTLKQANRRAASYGDAGRLDEAFDCLDQAIASRNPAIVYLAVAPQWDSLRSDPRFTERLRRLALVALA